MRTAGGLFAVVLGSALWFLAGAVVAPAAAAEDTALLRVAHLSPDSPAVDVAVAPSADGPLTDPGPDVAAGLAYGDVGAFTTLPAGSYAVSIRAAGAPRSTPPSLSVRVELAQGQAHTLAVSGTFADLALQVLDDDLTAPPAGSARVRVLAAAAGADALDVALDGGPPLASGLAFPGAAPPVVVPAGPSAVRIGDQPPLPVDLAAGSVSTLLVLDRPDGGLTVRTVLDAVGPQVVPTGAVEAGSGGAAGAPGGLLLFALTAVAFAVLSGGRRRAVAVVLTVVAGGLLSPAPAGAAPSAVQPGVSLVASAASTVADPVRLRVPSAGIDTALAGIGRDGTGALVPPADDGLAGWYREGPAPGLLGPAVLTGHVDGPGGPAVFFGLRRVAVGDPVLVERADGTTAAFTVTRVERYPKSGFPSAEVYGPTPGAELRLITCGGAFDRARGSYVDNVVVYAVLA